MDPIEPTAQPPNPSTPPPRIVALLLVAGVLAACVATGLGSVGLIGPDEPRYAR